MENFYLELNEELFSIIDRIKRSRDEHITLLVPSGFSLLRSIINLKILKEEAISLGKNVSIVTSDNLIRKLAQQSGLEVLDKPIIDSAEKEEIIKTISSKRIISDIISSKKTEIPFKEAPQEVLFDRPLNDLGDKEENFDELFKKPSPVEVSEDEDEIIREEKPSFRIFTKKRIIVALIVIFSIGFGFIIYFVLPRAQIIINPKKEIIRFETEIVADKNIDSVQVSDNTIPAQVFQLEMEDSRKFPTTGEKEVEERAKGIVVIYNQYSSSPQTLVKTTRFLSEGGKLFRLAETTVIPGATIEEGKIIPSSKEVEIIADEPGEAYNIGPSNFTIPGFEGTPKYTAFYGRSTEPMTGGAIGKMRIATKDDVKGAIEIVSLELKDKARNQFNKKIPIELKLLENAQDLEIIMASSSLQPDEPGKEFIVTVKAKVWGLAFKEDDVFYLTEKNFSDKLSENKILLPSTIQVNYVSVEIDSVRGKAKFSCQVEAEAAWRLDEDKLKNNLIGKNEIEVRKYLSSLTEIEGARVVFWPLWVKKIPKDKDKIKILIKT